MFTLHSLRFNVYVIDSCLSNVGLSMCEQSICPVFVPVEKHSFIWPAADNQCVCGSELNWSSHSTGQAALLPDQTDHTQTHEHGVQIRSLLGFYCWNVFYFNINYLDGFSGTHCLLSTLWLSLSRCTHEGGTGTRRRGQTQIILFNEDIKAGQGRADSQKHRGVTSRPDEIKLKRQD